MACIDCSYALQARNPDLEILWHGLVESCLGEPYIPIFRHDGQELDERFYFLEEMRFIVTHEREPHWHSIRLLGFTEGSSLICIHRHMT